MISVIIPNYNGEKTILKTINSIRDKVDEIIIIDDNSQDDSVKLIKRFPDIKIIQNKKSQWIAKCRNQGIDESKGDIVMFMDCDVYLKNGFDNMINDLKTVDIVSPLVYFENGKLMHPERKDTKEATNFSCIMLKRKVLKKVRFDETYQFFFEDVDFLFRAKFSGFTSKYSSAVAIHCLKYEITNQELKFYFRTRNLLYGYFKFRYLLDDENFYDMALHFKGIHKTLTKQFLSCFLNHSYRKRFEETKKSIYSIKMKITEKPRFYLVYLYFKAILWNLMRQFSKMNLKKYILV